jgi:hypothetical protein
MIGTNLANSSDTSKFLPDGVDPRPGGYAMRPTYKLFLFALIIFLLFVFGTVPSVNAQEPIATATVTAVKTIEPDFATAEPVICGDLAESYDRSISLLTTARPLTPFYLFTLTVTLKITYTPKYQSFITIDHLVLQTTLMKTRILNSLSMRVAPITLSSTMPLMAV